MWKLFRTDTPHSEWLFIGTDMGCNKNICQNIENVIFYHIVYGVSCSDRTEMLRCNVNNVKIVV